MPSNKDRLYVALYARGKGPQTSTLEARYHWALLSGPKTDDPEYRRGSRYHVKQRIIPPQDFEWFFEEMELPPHATGRLLVRIAIAKIENLERVRQILRTIPVRQGISTWTCKTWIEEALASLEADAEALGTRVTEWEKVRDAAISYCDEKKKAHRFEEQGSFNPILPPTFDLMTNEEVIP